MEIAKHIAIEYSHLPPKSKCCCREKKCLTIYRKYDIIIYIDYKVILYF